MCKYTPGPWRAALYLGGAYYITDAPLHEPRGREIAQVFGSLHGPAGIVTAGENARLIAAAPDLAEALFNLLAAVGEIGLTQAQIEAMAKACDAASAALIASGRVMG